MPVRIELAVVEGGAVGHPCVMVFVKSTVMIEVYPLPGTTLRDVATEATVSVRVTYLVTTETAVAVAVAVRLTSDW